MPSASFELRDARASELEAIDALCLRSKAHWGYDEEFMRRCREALRLSPAKLASCPTRVAVEASGKLLGVGCFSLDEAQSPNNAELELLFVEPEAMGRGVGRALLDDLRRALSERGCTTLWILSDPEAEGFYASQGAERVELRPSDCIPGRELPWLRLKP